MLGNEERPTTISFGGRVKPQAMAEENVIPEIIM